MKRQQLTTCRNHMSHFNNIPKTFLSIKVKWLEGLNTGREGTIKLKIYLDFFYSNMTTKDKIYIRIKKS